MPILLDDYDSPRNKMGLRFQGPYSLHIIDTIFQILHEENYPYC